MAKTASVLPVKLFVVTLHRDLEVLEKTILLLKAEWGDIDFVSVDFPFEVTDYYEKEMGKNLLRRFYSFERLISPEQIVDCKIYSNKIEEEFAIRNHRRINVDPGYLDYHKVVLASSKFGGQKLYLRDGIYADMTMILYKGKWESFAWGFPDFKSGAYDNVLFAIRNLYKANAKEARISE
jgi:Domain of unknown function (DUF4416)